MLPWHDLEVTPQRWHLWKGHSVSGGQASMRRRNAQGDGKVVLRELKASR